MAPTKPADIDALFVDTPTIEREPSLNEYDPIVSRLRDIIDGGDSKSYPLTAKPDDIAKVYRRFGDAAKRHDRSPRRVEVTEDKDAGTITYLVTLRPAIVKGKNKADADVDTEAPETAE